MSGENTLTAFQKYYRKHRARLLKERSEQRSKRSKLLSKTKEESEYIKSVMDTSKNKPVEELTGQQGLLCSRFGCGKVLSLIEKLSGSTCIEHQNRERKLF